MKVIGLTGGIASGKSTITKYIESKGIPVVDGDRVSREVVLNGLRYLCKNLRGRVWKRIYSFRW